MKTIDVCLAAALLFWALPGGSFAALGVFGLRCEYRVNPLGVDTVNPRLSWMLNSDEHDQRQTAYQIIAGTARGIADLWDSGKVASDQSVHVPYYGKPLYSGQRVYWNVRVWDKQGNPSARGREAFWEMGLLKSQDWGGKWIGLSLEPEYAQSRRFEKPWWIWRQEENPARAWLKKLVIKKRFKASKGTVYFWRSFVLANESVEKADFFLAAITTNKTWKVTKSGLPDSSITCAEELVLLGGQPWGDKPAHRRIVYSDLQEGEFYDARRELDGWARLGYSDKNWQFAQVLADYQGQFTAQSDEPVKIMATIKSVQLTEPEPGVFIFDLGQNIAGWTRLKVRGPRGARIKLRFAEMLNPDGMIYVDNLRQAEAADHYILKGRGIEAYEPCFTYHGFRYVEVRGYPGRPVLDSIEGRVVHSAMPTLPTNYCYKKAILRGCFRFAAGRRQSGSVGTAGCRQKDSKTQA
ncbi:MAG: family 78 glycoside hydrolase catalytic domain [Elusimicrobia bacterium]|nr:family 78 glycoside hydrolase catalytic domain [Elusimicrobiota bacterium]